MSGQSRGRFLPGKSLRVGRVVIRVVVRPPLPIIVIHLLLSHLLSQRLRSINYPLLASELCRWLTLDTFGLRIIFMSLIQLDRRL